jgi:hypothetical protein
MSHTKRVVLLAGAALGFASTVLAQTANDANRAFSAELQADAQARTSELGSAAAGHDGKFFISDDSGDYRLNVGGFVQFRYTANFRDEDTNDFAHGFTVHRARFKLYGTVAGDWGYFLQFDTNRTTGAVRMLDAFITHKLEGGWTLGAGEFRLPYWREFNIGATSQLAVERSAVSFVFNQGRSQGVFAAKQDENFAFAVAFTDGVRTNSSDFTSGAEADWAFSGRVDYKVRGDWKQFNDFTSWQGSAYGVKVGGTVHYQSSGDTMPEAASTTKVLGLTGDVQVEGNGWNFFAAAVWQRIDNGADFDDLGALVQGGWFLTDQDEIFGRWDAIFQDSDRTGSDDDDFHFLTVGWNHYFIPHSHAVKFTGDIVISLNDTSSLAIGGLSTANGLLGDNDEGEIAARAQLQLVF